MIERAKFTQHIEGTIQNLTKKKPWQHAHQEVIKKGDPSRRSHSKHKIKEEPESHDLERGLGDQPNTAHDRATGPAYDIPLDQLKDQEPLLEKEDKGPEARQQFLQESTPNLSVGMDDTLDVHHPL